MFRSEAVAVTTNQDVRHFENLTVIWAQLKILGNFIVFPLEYHEWFVSNCNNKKVYEPRCRE